MDDQSLTSGKCEGNLGANREWGVRGEAAGAELHILIRSALLNVNVTGVITVIAFFRDGAVNFFMKLHISQEGQCTLVHVVHEFYGRLPRAAESNLGPPPLLVGERQLERQKENRTLIPV